ncbi:protein-tyrosine sulfotransferase 2-like [Symsagittifera roscoffensis]|uniref:protein-tyrosine sulfotransferase 2-like n=1 Tax=Symsagittifera roscoffensis TaxID=84072 RepID=UPI00307B99C2
MESLGKWETSRSQMFGSRKGGPIRFLKLDWTSVPPVCLVVVLQLTLLHYLFVDNNCRNAPASEQNSGWFHFFRRSYNISKSTDKLPTVVMLTGFKGSGVHLMRVLLDSHSQLNCPNLQFMHMLLGKHEFAAARPVESKRLEMGGYTRDVIQSAFGALRRTMLLQSGIKCWTDYDLVSSLSHFNLATPDKLISFNVKLLLVIRDGRAVALRSAFGSGEDEQVRRHNFSSVFRTWNIDVENQLKLCDNISKSAPVSGCLKVFYEELVSDPEKVLKEVASFIGLSWETTWLHHHEIIGKSLKLYPDLEEVDKLMRPINMFSYRRWGSLIRNDTFSVNSNFLKYEHYSSMLAKLGYIKAANSNADSDASNGADIMPSELVVSNERLIRENNMLYSSLYWNTHPSEGYLLRPKPYAWRLIDSVLF